MSPTDDDTWEAEYWDELLREFGVAAYIEAREQQLAAYGHERKDRTMEFTVSITGRKEVNLALENLFEDVANTLDNDLAGSDLENVDLSEFDTPDIDITVSFTADLRVELDSSDLEQLVRDQAENTLANAGITDFDIDTVDEN
jgi:hypothetical protein